jgi:hypothetical protein
MMNFITSKTKNMNATVNVSPNGYGFGHDWTLVVNEKYFWLGQDDKFCHRVLGLESAEVAARIGSNNLGNPKVRQKLAKFIIKTLGLTDSEIAKLQPWQLSAD